MKLLEKINELKNSEIGNRVSERLAEFSSNRDRFSELCFCILTANSTAERCIRVQEKVGKGFESLRFEKLVSELKKNGCRFHTKRAEYIISARENKENLYDFEDVFLFREWLVKNIKGIGMKESSHFLRNIGYFDVAIIDFHIIDILVRERVIGEVKKLDRKNYLKIEEVLREMSSELGMSLGELDLYLWFMETGKVLK